MTDQVLEALVSSLAMLPQDTQRMHWLGGEPTLAGINFFQRALRLQKKYPSKNWVNTIQTNATLINIEWANFFKTHRFNVGVSIDGTQEAHDAAYHYECYKNDY